MSEQPPSSKPNYGSATRVAQIVHLLHQLPLGVTLDELTDRLGIHQRTLSRYINTLKDALYDDEGLPLVEVSRAGGRGRLRFRRKGTRVDGSAYELMSLYMALDLMAFLEGTFLLEGAQEVIDRLQKTLIREHGHQTNLVLKDFKKKFYNWSDAPKDYSKHNSELDHLVKALVAQRSIKMDYQSPNKPVKEYLIKPLSLLMYKRGLYLVGYNENNEERTFAVERIKRVTVLKDSSFAYPQEYNPENRFRGSFGLVGGRQAEEVLIKAHATVAQNITARRWHASQKNEILEDGSALLKMEVELGAEFEAWLLGYGQYVQVLKPESLKNQIVKRLEMSLALYGASS